MEIKIPLAVTNLVFLLVGLYLGFTCSAHADYERIQHGATSVTIERLPPPCHTDLAGSTDPCLSNIEKLCAEMDSILIQSSGCSHDSQFVAEHNKTFSHTTKH